MAINEASLAEAAVLCEKDLSYPDPLRQWLLRDASIRPRALISCESDSERAEEVELVVARRHSALTSFGRNWPNIMAPNNYFSNLLIYYPGDAISDGAAYVASDGYFDMNAEPPWDSWIGYALGEVGRTRSCLLAWVPSACRDMANRGIERDMIGCIRWLSSMDPDALSILLR